MGESGGAGQQTFGVGTRGITRFTAAVVVVMLVSAVLANKTGKSQADSLIDAQSESILDAQPDGE